jgi:hypothetical protein
MSLRCISQLLLACKRARPGPICSTGSFPVCSCTSRRLNPQRLATHKVSRRRGVVTSPATALAKSSCAFCAACRAAILSIWITRYLRARRYLEVVRQRRSATIAANKLSVAKRTGKFSTWIDDAATQQVAANRKRTVSSSTDLFSTTIWTQRQNCRSLYAQRHDSESCSGRDGAHQRRGVDLIGHGGLCHIDDGEEQELGVVEDRQTLHLGGGKGE